MSNLSQVQFKAQLIDSSRGLNSVKAVRDNEEIGSLFWHNKSGKIENIEVYHPENRRQGIATGMFNEANRVAAENNLNALKHSDKRTEEGDAWAKSVGGHLPERKFCSICNSPTHSARQCPEKADWVAF